MQTKYGRKPLARLGRTWEDNILKNLKKMNFENMK
jgi:hypothetical protein